MKAQEFKEKLHKLDFTFTALNHETLIESTYRDEDEDIVGYIAADVSTKNRFEFSIHPGLDEHNIEEVAKEVIAIITEYASTPIDERDAENVSLDDN